MRKCFCERRHQTDFTGKWFAQVRLGVGQWLEKSWSDGPRGRRDVSVGANAKGRGPRKAALSRDSRPWLEPAFSCGALDLHTARNLRRTRARQKASPVTPAPGQAPCHGAGVDLQDPVHRGNRPDLEERKTSSFSCCELLWERRRKEPPTQWLARILAE
jgi:hypothetical protein